jgi:multidrug efflux system membrane fusion protein
MDTSTTTTGRPTNAPPEQSPKSAFEVGSEKRHHWWIWVVFAALILGAAYWMYHQHQAALQAAQARAAQQNRAVPVATSTVGTGNIGVYQEGLGIVTPLATVTVTSRVQGEIVEIHYREGQMVGKGDPLIDIDPRPYQAQLSQAEGQLAHDEALLAQARIDLDRYQAAFSRNAIAQQQVYDQEQLVKQNEGTVKNDQGLVDNAKVNLVYCHITSPISGRVGLRLVDIGNMVQANSTTGLVVVAQLQPITVIFSIAEDYLPQIQQQLRQGHKMVVYALERTDETQIAAGTLLTIDNQIDTTTGTVKLRAIFPNTDSSLFPNQFVNAKLLVNTLQGVNVVPAAAIQRNAQGAFVYVVKPDQTASIQNVTVGTADGDTTQVDGVETGQVIVINGFDKLQDGIKVVARNGSGKGTASDGSGAGSAAGSGSQASKRGGKTKS